MSNIDYNTLCSREHLQLTLVRIRRKNFSQEARAALQEVNPDAVFTEEYGKAIEGIKLLEGLLDERIEELKKKVAEVAGE